MPGWKPGAFPLGDARTRMDQGVGVEPTTSRLSISLLVRQAFFVELTRLLVAELERAVGLEPTAFGVGRRRSIL